MLSLFLGGHPLDALTARPTFSLEVIMSKMLRDCLRQFNVFIVFTLLLLAAAPTFAKTTHRSIMDFVDAQGQVSFGPPGTQQVAGVADFVGFTDTKRDRAISADYAGLADKALHGALGTTFDGDIT